MVDARAETPKSEPDENMLVDNDIDQSPHSDHDGPDAICFVPSSPVSLAHTLALLNKLNIGRQSTLWKWRLPRHAGRKHARSHAVCAGVTISFSSSPPPSCLCLRSS